MRPRPHADDCPASVKLELVLRLLGGASLASLSRETGRPRKQLSTWRRRFLEGGQARLEGRADAPGLDALRSAHEELTARVAALETENRMLVRRASLAGVARSGVEPHPYGSDIYAHASEEPGVQPLWVGEWGTYVLVRERDGGVRRATGMRPLTALDPGGDLSAGLDTLRRAGISSISLVTDPMWSPEPSVLEGAFAACRPFRTFYVVDREAEIHFHKRHRNRLNQALRVCTAAELALTEQLPRWHELYAQNVAAREIGQPFSPAYFERIAALPSLRTIAVLVDDEIVTMTLWLRHHDTLYFHEGASSFKGYESSAGYVAFARAIEHAGACRYLLLGGSGGAHDDRLDGLAMFRRGFSNASALSYVCSAILHRDARPRARARTLR